MKKRITLLFLLLSTLSLSAGNLLLTNFEDVTCTLGTSGGWGSEWSVVDGAGKVTVPANNQGQYIIFSLPANFDANQYAYLKITVKSTETNYRFVPEYLKADWTGSADWNHTYKYTGNGAWQDVYISLAYLTPGTAGTYAMVNLKVAAYDNKPSFDLYIDNVTFIEKYVPDYTKDVVITDFDNVMAPMGGWSSNTIGIASNPDGIGNGGLVSVPANNGGGISITAQAQFDPATHNKIKFRMYAAQTVKFTWVTVENKDDNTIKKQLPNLNYTTPNEWQIITADLSSIEANQYQKFILGAEAWQNKPAFTFYIDDVILVNNNTSGTENIFDDSMISYLSSSKLLRIKAKNASTVELFSTTGSLIHRENIQGDSDINISHLKNGIYLVRVTGENIHGVKKIFIN
ncbi:exported hypothetical protein [uncultured Paludibacter sp.]|uniref:Secretion system C-terminal sorting domain-containing protein n=1 Tax=uncultured Paludibacter sp. TaxID=497635 RepID=A0A653ACN7_9BACT|nr:exported hypothetical protein [uncultured Paludibacter sp.]